MSETPAVPPVLSRGLRLREMLSTSNSLKLTRSAGVTERMVYARALAKRGPFERQLPSASSGSEVARVSLAAAARSPGSRAGGAPGVARPLRAPAGDRDPVCAGARASGVRFPWRRRPAAPRDEGVVRRHEGGAAAGHLLHVTDDLPEPAIPQAIDHGRSGAPREWAGHEACHLPATMIARPAHRFALTADDAPVRSPSKSAAQGVASPRCDASLRADPVWVVCARIDRARSLQPACWEHNAVTGAYRPAVSCR